MPISDWTQCSEWANLTKRMQFSAWLNGRLNEDNYLPSTIFVPASVQYCLTVWQPATRMSWYPFQCMPHRDCIHRKYVFLLTYRGQNTIWQTTYSSTISLYKISWISIKMLGQKYLLLTWFNFDNGSIITCLKRVWWNCISIPKLQWLHRRSLGMN